MPGSYNKKLLYIYKKVSDVKQTQGCYHVPIFAYK